MTSQTFLNFVSIAAQDVSTSTAANYYTAVRSFVKFNGGNDVSMRSVSTDMVKRYERWLTYNGKCRNTISCYIRSLRAIYNKSVYKRKVNNNFPFSVAYTGNESSAKAGLRKEDINKLRNLSLPTDSFAAFARDLFLFSFYAMGMPPVDIAHLKWTQIKDGMIKYSRCKTGRQVCVYLEPCMKKIIDKYRQKNSRFVFPIQNYFCYASFLSRYNRTLKRIGKKAGIRITLSSYVARHSWASIAYSQGISLPIISKALGHSNTKTTLIYINDIDNSLLAEANKKVLRDVLCTPLCKRYRLS